MLDALLGRKFYTKCKTNLKLIRTRMEKITKRRNAMQKFFRSDIADLLKNDLDINAYGRAEGLLVEINMSSCYEMIEQFCGCILSNLSAMDKQTECPDECREAVASLMYAAARFADLPELRELRSLFSKKYGNFLDSYVSKEFVERLKLKPPTKEMKLQLLQEIAQEASIEWDAKALEQRLYTPPPSEQNRAKNQSFGKVNDKDDDIQKQKQCKLDIPNPKMDEEVAAKRSGGEDPSENKKPHHNGLVPPPPYNAKMKEVSPAASSDSETSVGTEKPKPRSVRRNRSNQEATRDNEESPKRHSGMGTVYSDSEEEERLDGLLRRYSKKVTRFVPEKQKSNLQPPPYLRSYGDPRETRRNSMGRDVKHTRGQSLPQAPSDALSPRTVQAPTRAGSFDPDGATRHIHPNLPNYEDLASRIASLTRR
uniref:IST1-like protein n=2 Tax=Kalanchoe fedtschenkoi TaxID=63787 RepID=A0A7N0ZUJ8_KALFE